MQSGNSNEGCLPEVDNFELLHPEVLQEEVVNISNDSSRSTSESSLENMIEVITGMESEAPSNLKDDGNVQEQVAEAPYPDSAENKSPLDIPTIQIMERNEQYDPDRIPVSVFDSNDEPLISREWSTTSNESLFSIHPKTFSYGGDQSFPSAAEMPKEQHELQKSEDLAKSDEFPVKASNEPGEEKESSQGKMKNERLLPNASMFLSNPSPLSDGSDASDYSFAFPILVPNPVHSSCLNKGDALSSRWRPSMVSGPQRSNTLQRPPTPHKERLCCCCCCFSCPSCSSCCTLPSCPSCSSCCTLPSCSSCFSCCNFPSCFSCCTRRSCCKKCCCCFFCWPCR